jgi:phosphohistidine phosphatase
MKLHLLRHAKTESQSATGKDFDRQLAQKGILQATNLKTKMDVSNVQAVYCSSSARTRKTWKIISQDTFLNKVIFTEELYLASHMEMLNFINSLEENHEILLIGHNEGISDLATYLCDDFIQFKTSEYCVIDLEIDSWKELSKGQGKITFRYRPEILE